MSDQNHLWRRYCNLLCTCESINLSLDISRVDFPEDFFESMAPDIEIAFDEMQKLEDGEIANPDEDRQVGHYWLRDPDLSPGYANDINNTLQKTHRFTADIHQGNISPPHPDAPRFTDILVIGIGGSALGPQFVRDALGDPTTDKMAVHFLDNTDPDGIDRTLQIIGPNLKSTLSIVISKSGGTPETRNAMILAKNAYENQGLEFPKHAVAITGEDPKLDKVAASEDWLLRLPMWDWVGGRTSETGPVGLLPAALQGLDIDAILAGARACDQVTRNRDTAQNPAALMALMWHKLTNAKGEKDMVVLPYKDRLLLFSRYLQQLVMESLGKAEDLDGNPVEQGIAVYGNKGSTDQHAYVQQLREGVNNFFAVFIRVLEDAPDASPSRDFNVEPRVTSGDYLDGFLLGTRQALFENDRQSLTITINKVNAFSVGVLIALFERAVGLYATLININAYHQPGVEAGKKAAANVLDIQQSILDHLASSSSPQTPDQIARAIAQPDAAETIHHILVHLAANNRVIIQPGQSPDQNQYATHALTPA